MRIFAFFLLAGLLFAVSPAKAQEKTKFDAIPGLTSEQKKKLVAIEEDYDSKKEEAKEKKKEAEKKLKQLKTAYPADIAAIEKAFDEVSKWDLIKEKSDARGEQEIRKVLNATQRTFYDTNIMYKPKKK